MSNSYLDKIKLPFAPKVAICIAAFNGTHWLVDQLESILAQEGVTCTVFISVDRSTDGTEAWFEERAKVDRRIVLLPCGERFGGAARNFFRILKDVDLSEYDYVAFADQDDIWLPNKLLRAHERLSSADADAYSSNVTAFWQDGRKVLVKKSQGQARWDFLFEAAGPGCTYVMRKNLVCAFQDLLKARWAEVQRVGLHDWFVYAFARTHGYHWVIDDYASMLYRQHEYNEVGVNKGWKALRYRADKVLSGWGFAQSVLIAELVGLGNDPFIRRWAGGSRWGLLWLACHAWQCRRRRRDKLWFALSCLVLCVTGKRRT